MTALPVRDLGAFPGAVLKECFMEVPPALLPPTLRRRWHTWARGIRAQLEALPDHSNRPLSWAARSADRTVRWYQDHISAGRNRCSRGPERNCSRLGRRAIHHYGAFTGSVMIVGAILLGPHDPTYDDCRKFCGC